MILIVPGFFGRKGVYNHLSKKLEKAGFVNKVVDLGFNTKGLECSSKKLKNCINESPGKCDIIAHSFGGIVLKYLIASRPEIKKKINGIIFVTVPHGGSWMALMGQMFSTCRELLPTAEEINKLKNVELPEETVNFIAGADLVIWPARNALLNDRIDTVIPKTNHLTIINNDNFISKAIEFIKSGHDRIFI